MHFPYEGKTDLGGGSVTLQDLADAHGQVEELLLGLVLPDPNVTLIARFDGTLTGHRGQQGLGVGALRYRPGRFPGSGGVLVERGGQNLLANPSAEFDLAGWSAADPCIELTRDTAVAYQGDGTVSQASFKLRGNGQAGPGYVKTSVAVSPGSRYSASVYVHCTEAAKAKLELAFSGGTPATSTGSEVSVPAGTWTRLTLEEQESGDNTACEVRVYLVQAAPAFVSGSRLSQVTPTATAPVTDSAMALSAGDVVLCAVTAHPDGPKRYAWHMVTSGATGISNATLRLDGCGSAPTFVTSSRLSRWAPGATVLADDDLTTLDAGDLVFCRLAETGYGWHAVTAAGTAASTTLRLDDGPSAPDFADGSRISRYAPTDTALASDVAMSLAAGDLVFCYSLGSPGAGGYGWHLVTNGATGVSSGALRLDGASGAPNLAGASRFSRLSPTGTAGVSDGSLALAAGDFAFCSPAANPAGSGYGWHMVSTGATGVSSAALRLDQASSQTLHVDCVQLEAADTSSTYVDELQGPGYSGFPGSVTQRAATTLDLPAAGVLAGSAGTVAFWMAPLWSGDDGLEHVLLDTAESAGRNRLRFSKSREDRLVLSLYDDDAWLKQVVGDSAVTFVAGAWVHLAFTWASGTLAMYLDGQPVAASTVGSGSAVLQPVPARMFLGTDSQGRAEGGAIFDDLVVKDAAATAQEIAAMARANSPFQGLALAQGAFTLATGRATTDSTPGTQSAVDHGLGVTPSFVQVTERGDGLVYLSAEADATSFYVKGSAASVGFDWRAWA